MQRLLIMLALSLTACATHQTSTLTPDETELSFDSSLFPRKPDIVDASELFVLRENQRSAFIEYFHDPARQKTLPHERVYDYLQTVTAEFDFHWADNIQSFDGVSELGVNGDSAPNRRWNYRYEIAK